jgi:hypothetical protein
MRWDGFSRSVAFGAAAAAAYVPFALAIGPALGRQGALFAFLALLIPFYLTGIGLTRRRGVAAAVLATGIIVATTVSYATVREGLVVVALALGLARSGLAQPGTFVRSVVLETLLFVGGLSVASVLVGSSTLSVAIALWGFFLVQSVFFLVAGPRSSSSQGSIDPFDEAHDRATAILDDSLGRA